MAKGADFSGAAAIFARLARSPASLGALRRGEIGASLQGSGQGRSGRCPVIPVSDLGWLRRSRDETALFRFRFERSSFSMPWGVRS